MAVDKGLVQKDVVLIMLVLNLFSHHEKMICFMTISLRLGLKRN